MNAPRWMVWGVIGSVLVSGAMAQQPAPDLATLRKNVERLGRDLRRAQQEVTFTEGSMRRLDTEIETGVGALVDLIAKSKDSPGTDDRIAACRARAVASLRRSLALYVAEREQRRLNGWDTSRLDERIDLRIQQMAKVAESYGPEQAPVKSTSLLDDMWIDAAVEGLKAGKYMGEDTRSREEMVRELDGVIQFLTSRRDTLTLQLAVTVDPAEKLKIEQAIADADGLAEKRREQLAQIMSGPSAEPAAMVGVDAASALEKALNDGRIVLRTKLMELQKLATTRDYQQKRADYIKRQLAEAQAAMDQRRNGK